MLDPLDLCVINMCPYLGMNKADLDNLKTETWTISFVAVFKTNSVSIYKCFGLYQLGKKRIAKHFKFENTSPSIKFVNSAR